MATYITFKTKQFYLIFNHQLKLFYSLIVSYIYKFTEHFTIQTFLRLVLKIILKPAVKIPFSVIKN